jgi:regulatory protein
MKIIRVVRKDEKNVIVYFDNDVKLILSEDVFYNSGLRKDDEVSEDRYSFFIEQNILYHIKQRALSFLGRRFHSEKELFQKLKSKSYEENLIKIVLQNLKVHSFIDDKNFASHFIEEKLKRKKWGMNNIKSALYTKGVSSIIIDELLKEFDNAENNHESITEIATKKINQLRKRNVDEKKLYQKVITFLLSRGFDYETSGEVCKNIIKQDFD